MDTSPLASSITRDARLADYTDRLVRHVAEQAGSEAADSTQAQVDNLCDMISEDKDITDALGSLVAYLTTELGSTHMVEEGPDDLINLILHTATEPDPDAVEKSWEPYVLEFDGARYAE